MPFSPTHATTWTLTVGLMRTTGEPITEDEFWLFINTEVLPLMPDISVRDELGFWQGNPEPCRVITIIRDNFEDELVIYAIAARYQQQFQQDAVMINSYPSVVDLV